MATPLGADELLRLAERIPAAPLSEAAVEAYRVEIDLTVLEREADTLEVTLFDGRPYRVRRDGVERRGPGDLAWRGRFEDGAGRATLTLKHGFVVGRLESPDGLYELVTLRAGGQGLARLEDALFPGCATDSAPGHRRDGAARDERSGGGALAGTDPADHIDVMGVYTPQAETAAGGPAAIQATIQAAIDVSNTAFIDSDMVARFFLVHSSKVGHNDSGNMSVDLGWLANDPGVAALRDVHAADMVGLTVENGGGSCGIAFVMRNPGPGFEGSAFQVTDRGCAVGNLTYPHEHGHNMGFEHDPANGTPPGNASYPWSFGHYVDGSYRTVMSYSNQCTMGCTRVAHFSNPDILHEGVPTGIADERDNARSGDLTAPIVANFRLGAGGGMTLVVTGSCPGLTTITINGATAGGNVGLLRASSQGDDTVPGGPCVGTPVDIENPSLLKKLTADGSGTVELTRNVPAGACGQYLQAIDVDSCTTSNVFEVGAE